MESMENKMEYRYRIAILTALVVVLGACTPVTNPAPNSAPVIAPSSTPSTTQAFTKGTLPAEVRPAEPAIEMQQLPEERFSFKHVFIKHFLDGYTVKVQYDMRWPSLPPDASVEQPDGKWVAFSVDDPADRIIRDQPLHDIKAVVPEIERMEENWVRPNCVIDAEQQRWCKNVPPPAAPPKPSVTNGIAIPPSAVVTRTTGTGIPTGSGNVVFGSLVTMSDDEGWRSMDSAPKDGTIIEVRCTYGVAPWYGLFRWTTKYLALSNGGKILVEDSTPGWHSPTENAGFTADSTFTWRPYKGSSTAYDDPTHGAQKTNAYWLSAARAYRP